MAISDKSRKKLWGRAGSRCAMCNQELTELDGMDSIVGDEAHIRSRQATGPRFDAECPVDQLDEYANLVLLCKPHHKLVDDNPEVFPTDAMLAMKVRHEARVANALSSEPTGWASEPVLGLVETGTELTPPIHESSPTRPDAMDRVA